MNINLSFLGFKPRTDWKAQVEKEISSLEKVAQVSGAEVVLERRREAGPFFRLRASLAVPGPDFRAVAVDHTFAAALRKVVRDLMRQIQQRKSRRLSRRNVSIRNLASGQMAMRSC